MNRWKKIGQMAVTMLFLFSLVTLFTTGKRLFQMRPADDYEDRGVYSFYPYAVYPIQVENTAGGKGRRTNNKRTVYYVFYRSENSGYEWKEEAVSKSAGDKTVKAGAEVKRRVLSIKNENKYITIEPEYTAESYVSSQRKILTIAFAASAICLAVMGICALSGWMRHII